MKSKAKRTSDRPEPACSARTRPPGQRQVVFDARGFRASPPPQRPRLGDLLGDFSDQTGAHFG